MNEREPSGLKEQYASWNDPFASMQLLSAGACAGAFVALTAVLVVCILKYHLRIFSDGFWMLVIPLMVAALVFCDVWCSYRKHKDVQSMYDVEGEEGEEGDA